MFSLPQVFPSFRCRCLLTGRKAGGCARLLCVAIMLPVLWCTGCSGGSSSAGGGSPNGGGGTSSASAAPQISTPPTATVSYVGDTATFSVVAAGTPAPAYQWLRNGSAIAGATGSTYTTGTLALADDGAAFSVTVSNSVGSLTSSPAKLSVQIKSVSIATQPANVNVAAGASATFSVVATGSGPLAYQWLRSGTAISGATSSSYTLPVVTLADAGSTFTVTVSNAAGSVTSSGATLTVTPQSVSITTQPSGTTAFAGESVTFSVGASGSSPVYQWRRNGSPIAGANGSSYTLAKAATTDDGASFDVVVSNSSGSVTSSAAPLKVGPFATTYRAIYGATLNLFAWPGTKTAVLTGSNTLDPTVMRKFITASDNTYNYYAKTVGKEPGVYVNYNGLATVAEIPASASTCGAGCTYIGSTGMEMWDPYFTWITSTIPNGSYDQIMFYEYGRSFWLFPQLSFATGDDNSCLVTGYAVLMRLRSLNALGLQGSFNSFATGASDTANVAAGVANYNALVTNGTGLIDAYRADSSLTWSNTFLKNSYKGAGGASCSDLFTSMVQQLARQYGDEAFIQALWKQVLLRPAAKTTQDAIDNFVLAASGAANYNLTDRFINTYKWPVSTAASAEALAKYGKP